MQGRRRLVSALLAGLGVAACGPAGSGGDDPPVPEPACELDAAAWAGTDLGARAQVAAARDLLDGEAATGRVGDLLLANDRIRVLIEAADPDSGPLPEGGFLVDADLQRGGGIARDRFGKLGPFLQFGRTIRAERVEVVRDGRSGGPAVVGVFGRDATLDYVNLPGVAATYAPFLELPDVDAALHLRSALYYVLEPGATTVRLVQKLCNAGPEAVAFPFGDLAEKGGQLDYFSAGRGRFGLPGYGPSDVGELLAGGPGDPFVAWVGPDVAYGYLPSTERNQILTVSGVTGSVLGAERLLDWVGRDEAREPPAGAVVLEPGASTVIEREFAVTRDLAGIVDLRLARSRAKAGRLSGVVRRPDGRGAPAARVAAIAGSDLVSVFTTDDEGRFSGTLPAGAVRLVADDGVARSEPRVLEVTEGATDEVALSLARTALLLVRVLDEAGGPMPAKVTLLCAGACPSPGDDDARLFRDPSNAGPPAGAAAIEYVGATGEARVRLLAGQYTMVVSHGPEWSIATRSVTVGADDVRTLTVTLAHVVDTRGWTSGDFHVHSLGSPDSPVSREDRLLTFLAEGVDVIVSTDHDVVTDYRPYLGLLPGSTKWIRAMAGVETTTFDYGHYNGFPLEAEPLKRDGGAPDWTGGRGAGLTPGDIFQKLASWPDEQVVQVNHPRSGYFNMLGLDTRTLWTRAPAHPHRIREVGPDPYTRDTRLFDPRFTAIEVMNGFGRGSFDVLLNDWFALLSRGVRRTGTATSDVHRRHGNSGYPRTWVRTGTDDLSSLLQSDFARAVNAGRAIGGTGPFLLVTALAEGRPSAQPGDTLVTHGKPVTLGIEVRTPEWMTVNRAHVFLNSTDTATDDEGRPPAERPTPTATTGLEGVRQPNGSWLATTALTLQPAEDAWIVVIVEGDTDLFPVTGWHGVKPIAFSNPIYVDLEGLGWTPPVDLAAERRRVRSL